MKICDLLSLETINLDLKAKKKEEAIDELVNVLDKAGKLANREEFKKAIIARENISSTALEEGIAIPHAKTSAVKEAALAFGLSKEGIDYESLDEEPSTIFFMIAAPEKSTDAHIETLSKLTTLLLDDDFREELLKATSPQQVMDIINKREVEEKGEEEVVGSKKIIAVTACPTGIAHTYMAAEALNKAGKASGITVKVETNGSTGVKNSLTDQDIKEADAVIIAADKSVDTARFSGKKVLFASTKDAIRTGEELLKKALSHETAVYEAKGGVKKAASGERTGFYKHLMSGVSNMLPFVVGGGILIAISFMFGIKAFDPNDPSFHPFAKLLMDIGGGNAFFLMIPVLAGFIGMSIADRPGFAPAMIGGLIAANNGGGFLGALIGGFLGGYMVQLVKKACAKLPETFEGIKPVLLYPVFGTFLTGWLMYSFIIGPIAAINSGLTGFLNNLGTGNLVLLGIVLAGMMAVDMGGPVNKAAFTFGIAAIAAGNNAPHAAVMAGGMVPPLAIGLATTFFKNKFSQEERAAGKTCYILGASFITEGAIPFAAEDPVRVIPACILGSATAGGLAMLFGNTLPAPHGGLFVIPLVSNAPMYVVAILVGSVVSAAIIGVTRKSSMEELAEAAGL